MINSKYVQTTISWDSWRILKTEAINQDIPMGELLRNIIQEFINKNSLSNPYKEEINNARE